MNLSKRVKVTPVLAYAGATTGTVNGTEIDMLGWEGVMFVGGAFATANSGNYYHCEQDTATGMASAADLEGTKNTPGDNADDMIIDVYRPKERFVRIVKIIGSSSASNPVYAIQYGAHDQPTSHASTVDSETHISPAEGTI